MIAVELKTYPTKKQEVSIQEAIRTMQFVRNKAIRQWMDSRDSATQKHKEGQNSLYLLCKQLAQEFDFVKPLNSTARQAAVERAWSAVSRFYKGLAKFPTFQKDNRSVEFKQSGWKLSNDYKKISFKSCGIGSLKLKGTRNLEDFSESKIFRVRIIKRADGFYIQFCIDATRTLKHEPTGKAIGIDVGLKSFLTDSEGNVVANPRLLRKSETKLKRLHRRHSKCTKKSNNRNKARVRLARAHLKVSRQRKDFAIKTARQVITNSDFVAIEDLAVKNLVKNHCLAKSFSDAALSMFRRWLEYFGKISGVPVIAVPPQFTSQKCSECGNIVKKSLSERTHICPCGCVLDRDENAARNILSKAFVVVEEDRRVGHTRIHASGDETSTGELVSNDVVQKQASSLKEESAGF